MSESEQSPRVTVASLGNPNFPEGEHPLHATVPLHLTTKEGMRVTFDLDVAAVSLLSLMSSPVLQSLKTASESYEKGQA